MATFFTHELANSVLDDLVSDNSSLWLALFTAAPTKSGGGTEVSGGSYARVEMVMATVFPTSAASSQITSETAATFPTASASWGSVVGVGIMDASSSGNCLMYSDFDTPKSIGNGDSFSFPIGNLIIKNT